jgi:hypothetical protein
MGRTAEGSDFKSLAGRDFLFTSSRPASYPMGTGGTVREELYLLGYNDV